MITEAALSDPAWEAMYAPYDQTTYQSVLDQLGPRDIVLDIGAGDLRLARQMAQAARKVYAVDINARVLNRADDRTKDFPSGITAGVLLMRHCTCLRLYAEKLQNAGAAWLITNARWRMDVEIVSFSSKRHRFGRSHSENPRSFEHTAQRTERILLRSG